MQGIGSPNRSVRGAGSGPGTPGQCEAGCQGSGTAGAGTAGNAASVTREYVPTGNMNVNAGHPAAAPDPWQDWYQRHQIPVPPSVSSRDSQMPVYGNQGNQSCGQGFIGQNSCGQGFLGQTGFQNPNQVMPGFQNLVNQGAGNFGFAVPGNGPFQQGSGNFVPGNGSTGYSQGNSSQGDSVSLIRRLLQTMSPREIQMVFQSAGDQLSSGRGLFIPERLGQAQEQVGGEFLPDERGMVLPIPRNFSERPDESRDAFSRNEKWFGAPPLPSCDKWRCREDEIVGFTTFVAELSSWASQGSISFGREIDQAARWGSPISYGKLSKDQQARAVRLCAILKSSFVNHGRISLLISGFLEGLDIEPGSSTGDVFGNMSTYLGNGYELLRQLSKEFCLRSRSEALSLRAQLMAKEFKADSAAGNAYISDVSRQIDVACARYMRMISTLSGDLSGLRAEDSDQLTMLVRSLPSEARTYTLMHSSGENYGAYRLPPSKFEHQHRLFRELQMSRKPVFGAVESLEPPNLSMGSDSFGQDETVLGDEGVDGVAAGVGAPSKGTRCTRCGSKKHETSSCSTDLTRTKCFKCDSYGHVSMNCKAKQKTTPEKTKGQPKGSGSGSKGKGKGSKGKKGKMFAVVDDDGTWWYSDAAEEENLGSDAQKAEDENGNGADVLVLSGLLPNMSGVFMEHVHDLQHGETEWFDLESMDCLLLSPDASIVEADDEFGLPDASEEADDENMSPIRDLQAVYDSDWCVKESVDLTCQGQGSHCASRGCGCAVGDSLDSWGVLIGDDFEKDFKDTPSNSYEHCCRHACLDMHGVDDDGSLGFHYDGDCIVSSPCDHSVVLSSPVESCPRSGRWLLDSGASVSVVSPKVLEGMVHGDLKKFDGTLQAANGTPVSIQGFCRALIQVEVTGPKGNVVPAVIPLVVMVGDCAFPILSIGKLSKQGWKVSIGKEVSMIHEKTQCSVNGIEIWCDTPWIKVSKFTGTWKGDLSADLNDEAPEKSGHVKALTADEMVAHRLRGHVPYEPSCEVCQSCRGVHKHRRRAGNKLSTEVFADFGFLSQEGVEDEKQSFKFLVIKEVFSSSIGAIVVGDDKVGEQQLISKWFGEFGLRTSAEEVSVVLLTDSESAVSSMVSNVSGYQFLVQKAAPQSHESVGHAERSIRMAKEAFKVQLLEFEKLGYT